MIESAQGELRRLQGDGVILALEAWGDPGAPTVILLHGGGQSRSAWRGTAKRVAEHGYHCVPLDLRGHGDSDWAPDGDYGFDRHIADMAAVISALGAPATLIGASLGGHVSLLTAAAHPDLVRAVVLADVTPWLDETVADDLRGAMRAAGTGFADLAEAAASLEHIGGASRPPSERLRAHLVTRADGRLYWRWDPRAIEDRFVRHAGPGGLFERAALRSKVPVMVMRAEHSTITTPDQVAHFARVVPWLRAVEIPGIGHMLTGDSNRAYTGPILDFLDDIYPERPSASSIS